MLKSIVSGYPRFLNWLGLRYPLPQQNSNLNLRYTGGKNVNKNLLDDMLNNFSMQVNTIELKELKPKEDTRNGAELIKDGVI